MKTIKVYQTENDYYKDMKNIAKFDGSSAYLYPFNQEKYQKMNQTVTMECMVKFNSIPSGEHDIFSNQQSGGIGLGLDNGN